LGGSSASPCETRLAFETSSLKFRAIPASRNLSYFKPGVTWTEGSQGWHAQLVARRTVAQLDFDFCPARNWPTTGSTAAMPITCRSDVEFRLTLDRPITGKARSLDRP
jgi:hypothetical protein